MSIRDRLRRAAIALDELAFVMSGAFGMQLHLRLMEAAVARAAAAAATNHEVTGDRPMKGTELFGRPVTDKVTGFKGIATGYCQYMSGCNQVLVSPQVGSDGSHREGHWIDEQRLVVDAVVPPVVLDNGASPGFDKAAPVR